VYTDALRRHGRLAVAVLAVLAMTGTVPSFAQAGEKPSQTALPLVASRLAHGTPLRIVAFGSSSTEGAGASSPAASYPSRLEQVLTARLATPVAVLNRGIGGEDADDMARRVPEILAEKPDLVVWQTGTNDPLRGVPVERFVAETRAGIAAMRAAGVDVMLMEPQLCDRLAATAGADRYRLALRQIGAETGVPVVRRFDLMRTWLERHTVTRAAMMSGDGLHMADAGYALLATEVAGEILASAGSQTRAEMASGLGVRGPANAPEAP
jgi:acyl-CoA thioesterase I